MDERLYYQLNTAQHELRQFVDKEALARTGLTSVQMGLLFFVAKHDGCLQKDAGRGLGLKDATVTGLIARTERAGVIRRRSSPEDGRATQLFLTAKGRRLLTEVHELNRELNTALRGKFSSEEIAVVLRFLNHVRSLPQGAKSE